MPLGRVRHAPDWLQLGETWGWGGGGGGGGGGSNILFNTFGGVSAELS